MLGEIFERKGVSIDRLVTLCKVAEAGGVTAAANGDPVRQSQFSRQLKELEQGLGVHLLDRTSAPHKLTPDGYAVVNMASDFLLGFDQAVKRMRDEKLPVSIAAGESIIQWLLIPAMVKIIGRDGIRIIFSNLTSKASSEAVKSGRVDIAILHKDLPSKGLGSTNLGKVGLRLVGPAKLLNQSRLKSWQELSAVPIAVLEGRGSIRRLVENLVVGHPEGPFIALECTSQTQLLSTCSNAGMICIVPEIAARPAKSLGLAVAKITEIEAESRPMTAVWNLQSLNTRPEVEAVLNVLIRANGG